MQIRCAREPLGRESHRDWKPNCNSDVPKTMVTGSAVVGFPIQCRVPLDRGYGVDDDLRVFSGSRNNWTCVLVLASGGLPVSAKRAKMRVGSWE